MGFENFSENKPSEKNYYDILGISRDSSLEEIKRAFRNLAKETHPDAVGDDSRREDFHKINQAYETLIDEDKRKSYDYKIFTNHKSTNSNKQEYSNGGEQEIKDNSIEDLLNYTEYLFKNNPERLNWLKDYFERMAYNETNKEKIEKYRTVIDKINEKIDGHPDLDKEYEDLYNEMIKDKTLMAYLTALKMQSPEKFKEVVKEYLDVLRENKRARKKADRNMEEAERRKREAEQNLRDIQAKQEELKRKREDLERRQEELKRKGSQSYSGSSSNTNRHWANEWKKIRNLVDNIGVETIVSGYEKLVDCNTGRSIGYGTYKNIEYRNGVIIGTDLTGYKHLVTKDGKSSPGLYQDIIFRDDLVIAKDIMGEKLLNKNTGQPVGYQSYKTIQRVGNKIFGTNIIGRQEEIKL